MDANNLEKRILDLEQQMRDHRHSGHLDQRINLSDIQGKVQVVSVAPVDQPRDVSEQFKIYTNGSTYRFYWYDTTAGVWHYVTATS